MGKKVIEATYLTDGDWRLEIGDRSPVLQISGLTVAYKHGRIWQEAVRDFSLTIEAGQTVGLVGESGSGKTTAAMAVMGYLGENGRITQGDIIFNGRSLRDLGPKEMSRIWGRQINLVPQDPQSALNPSMRIQEQLAEPLRQHLGMNKKEANERAITLLEMARVPDPLRVAQSYPHQISGGMQQRVMIALALSTEPRLLILDEPTTNLDVTTQAAILDLFADLIRERDTAVLYVTHNLGVVANICDSVSVLYAGEQVEAAAAGKLFAQPIHPYTQGLMASVPQLGENKAQIQLQAIPGQIPALGERPSGCVFAPRCAVALDICGERPSLDEWADGRLARCHRWPEIVAGGNHTGTGQNGYGRDPGPKRRNPAQGGRRASLVPRQPLPAGQPHPAAQRTGQGGRQRQPDDQSRGNVGAGGRKRLRQDDHFPRHYRPLPPHRRQD
ncbi:MAG TPA: ABC transporter ATP-binding protein [Anaerolineae bacterium]|nr:ABC transporter ATP-binding protein [Anaerolineae bacterium]